MTELEIVKGKRQQAWQMLVYSVPGLGKSTFATTAPNPLFMDLEDGLAQIDCHKTPFIDSSEKLTEYLRYAFNHPEYKTIVLDTTSALESLFTKEILQANNVRSLADLGYGKGYQLLQQKFEDLWFKIDALKRAGRNILWISHEIIRTFSNPAGENYDRYHPRLYEKVAYALASRCDVVGFAQYDVMLKEKKTDNNSLRAVSQGKRFLHVVETPSHIAKNRFDLTDKIEIFKNNNEQFFKLLGN